jgi:glycosyltransferase involved in cell wall biosynthesis
MAARKKILWYKTRMPGCVRDGTSTVSLNLADCLASTFDIDLVTLRLTGKEDALADSICPPFRRVIVVAPDNAGSLLKRAGYRTWYTLLSWWHRVPRSLYYATGSATRKALRDQFVSDHYDLAVFEYFNTSPLLALAPCPTALILIDATFHTLAESCDSRRGMARWACQRNAEVMRHFECEMAAESTACFAISPRDIALLNNAGNIHPIEYLPVVFPPLPPIAAEGVAGQPLKPMRVCFMGSLEYPENRKALAWFLDSAWPFVREKVPTAELVVIGGGKAKASSDDKTAAGVKYIGWVEDLAGLLATCRCGVAPSVSGTGVKIKVLDMLWHGVPTVATSIAAAGTPAEHGGACVADDPANFAAHVVTLLLDEGVRTRIQATGRAGMEARHCGPRARAAIVERFTELANG